MNFLLGLVRGSSQGTIGGAIVLGISVVCGVILALILIFCLKNNNVDSNTPTHEQSSTHQNNKHGHHQRKHRPHQRQFKPEQTSTHEITVISGVHTLEKQSQQYKPSNEQDIRKISPTRQSNGLGESSYSVNGKQGSQTPMKTASFTYLNQSNSSTHQQNHSSIVLPDNSKLYNLEQY